MQTANVSRITVGLTSSHPGWRRGAAFCARALPAGCANAPAGRASATDDAGTTAPGTGQVQAGAAQADDEHALVVEPACGVAAGIERGVDFV
jgi:hypothetical protein